MLRKPWSNDKRYWKHGNKGNCHEVIFITTLNKTPEFVELFKEIGAEVNYPFQEIGIYIQPIEDMRACQMAFMFPYNPNDAQEFNLMKQINRTSIIKVINKGGYFNRIYEGVGDVVYTLPRVQAYVNQIRRVKRLFDPNWILSPRKLCF